MTESAHNGEREHSREPRRGGGAAGPPGRPRRPAALLPWLAGYRPAYLPLDLVAGVTLAAIAIPEQLATAHLAGMPVVAGLYAFLAAAAMFALLGSNRIMSVGADSTIAPMLAVAVLGVAGARLRQLRRRHGAAGAARRHPRHRGRCWRAWGGSPDFLSVPVVTGFLAGVAVTHHRRSALGGARPAADARQRGAEARRRRAEPRRHQPLRAGRRRRGLRRHRRPPSGSAAAYPARCIGVLLSLAASATFDLSAKGVATLGGLPAGSAGAARRRRSRRTLSGVCCPAPSPWPSS